MDLQLINLIGAAAIAISDSIQKAAEETTGNTASFPAALVIVERYPKITVAGKAWKLGRRKVDNFFKRRGIQR